MTRTAEVRSGDATIVYDVHGEAAETVPLMVLGSPMEAAAFAMLVDGLEDRTVVTVDPRGAGRTRKDVEATFNEPEQHAADLQAVVDELGAERVDVFATSGAAVTALAWVQAGAPIGTLVAHEPPLVTLLPDREHVTALVQRMSEVYEREGHGPAMARFIALVMHEGPFTAADVDAPAPNPAAFGLPVEDSGDRTDALLWQNRSCTAWQPDIEALRQTDTRILVGVGEESRANLPGRAALELAKLLGIEPTWLPGGHTGFLPPEHPGAGDDPVAFARRLRAALE